MVNETVVEREKQVADLKRREDALAEEEKKMHAEFR